MSLRKLVIYHSKCPDGFTAAWCFWHKYGTEVEFVPGVFYAEPPDVTGRDVFLVDFSYKRPVVEKMLKVANSVTLIDHHKTAIEELRPLFFQDSWMGEPKQLGHFVDLNRCGATLAWDYLFPGEQRPALLGYVEDADLFRFKLQLSREVNANIFSRDYTFKEWDAMMMAGPADVLNMGSTGKAILRKHYKDINELLSVCTRRMVIAGHDVPVAGLPYTMVGDASMILAEGEPFAACYWDTAETREFGLRSTESGIDVSEIALTYGGGGHEHASGFRVTRDHPLAQA